MGDVAWSETIMKDQRVVAEEALVVAAPESVLAMPSSVAIGAGGEARDITIQQYTPEIQQTIGKLIESVDVAQEIVPELVQSFGDVIEKTAGTFGQSLATISEISGRTTDILGEKLQETQLGQASILPGMAKYLLIAAVVIIVAGKVWK